MWRRDTLLIETQSHLCLPKLHSVYPLTSQPLLTSLSLSVSTACLSPLPSRLFTSVSGSDEQSESYNFSGWRRGIPARSITHTPTHTHTTAAANTHSEQLKRRTEFVCVCVKECVWESNVCRQPKLLLLSSPLFTLRKRWRSQGTRMGKEGGREGG